MYVRVAGSLRAPLSHFRNQSLLLVLQVCPSGPLVSSMFTCICRGVGTSPQSLLFQRSTSQFCQWLDFKDSGFRRSSERGQLAFCSQTGKTAKLQQGKDYLAYLHPTKISPAEPAKTTSISVLTFSDQGSAESLDSVVKTFQTSVCSVVAPTPHHRLQFVRRPRVGSSRPWPECFRRPHVEESKHALQTHRI